MKKNKLFSYGFLALPLSFVGLPIYVNISDFYARNFTINLAVIASLLLVVRIIDLLQDPFIGFISDRLLHKKISHQKIISFCSFGLAVCFYWLFNPPEYLNSNAILIWFTFFLIATYSFFNFIMVNYETSVILAAKNDAERISINSIKEFFGLIGILLAAATPTMIDNLAKNNLNDGYFWFSLIFAFFLTLGILLFSRVEVEKLAKSETVKFSIIVKEILSHRSFLLFLSVFFINSIAVSIPASVVIFYISDVLLLAEDAGKFLVVYFLAAAIFMTLWKKIAQNLGLVKTWSISIIGSIITFIFAFFISSQNAQWFYAICFFSGMFLGADLIMPPVIFAKLIRNKSDNQTSFVGIWNLVNKTALMIASFVSLIILSYFGYQPGLDSDFSGLKALSFVYAISPCIFKVLVIILLRKFAKKLEI